MQRVRLTIKDGQLKDDLEQEFISVANARRFLERVGYPVFSMRAYNNHFKTKPNETSYTPPHGQYTIRKVVSCE